MSDGLREREREEMRASFDNVKIQGISAVVPANVEDNLIFSEVLGGKKVKKQIAFTGIEKRHICLENQTIVDLCEKAFCEICEKLNWDSKDIDVLILVTQSPLFVTPSTAFLLHNCLHLKKECLVYDINMGCSGFNAGLHTIASLLSTQQEGAKGIFLIADDINRVIRNNSNELNDILLSHMMIFGSAASAIALEHKNTIDSMLLEEFSDGTNYEAIHLKKDEDFYMNGLDIFSFASTDVTNSVKKFIEEHRLFGQIDYFVFHQAEKAVLDEIQDILEIENEKFLLSYAEYGNTSGVSVPLTLCANIDKMRMKKNVRVLFCGFGIGLSWGLAYVNINTENIMSVIELQ